MVQVGACESYYCFMFGATFSHTSLASANSCKRHMVRSPNSSSFASQRSSLIQEPPPPPEPEGQEEEVDPEVWTWNRRRLQSSLWVYHSILLFYDTMCHVFTTRRS